MLRQRVPRWLRRTALIGAMTGMLLGLGTTPAQANLGWLYTTNDGGKAYFDKDANGEPGEERLAVCDIKDNGAGVLARVHLWDNNRIIMQVSDSSKDGECVIETFNARPEGTLVFLTICEYRGTDFLNGNGTPIGST